MLWGLIAALAAAAAAAGWAWRLGRRNLELGRQLDELRDATPPAAALHALEAKLAAAQKLAGLGYWEWDPAAGTLWWSAEEYELLGYEPTAEPSLELFFERVHPGDRERIHQAMQQLVESPSDADIEFRILHPERGERYIFSRTRVITDAEGRAVKLIGTEQDLTPLRLAEQALRDSEQRYRYMFNAAPVALWEQDYSRALAALEAVTAEYDGSAADYFEAHPDFVQACARRVRIVDVNEAAVELLGVESKAELVGPLDRLLVPDTHHVFVGQLVAISEGRRDYSSETRLTTRDGRRLHARLEARLPRTPEEAQRVLVSTLDVTSRKQAELDRERLITELEAKNAELERFTYTVSHDLRSPLVTIKGFLGCVAKDAADGDHERLAQDLERIGKAADHMERLLSELLQLSRLGRIAEPSSQVELSEVVAEARDRLAGPLAEGGVELTVAGDLPVVTGDRLRLLEVVQNLLENAVRFMGDQPRPRIEIGTRRDGAESVLFVRDNGVGIPPEHHDRVFDLFQRLDPATEGTGVGLALVRRIVEVHGGRIWVESEGTGRGSTFCLTLAAPAAAAASQGPEPWTHRAS